MSQYHDIYDSVELRIYRDHYLSPPIEPDLVITAYDLVMRFPEILKLLRFNESHGLAIEWLDGKDVTIFDLQEIMRNEL